MPDVIKGENYELHCGDCLEVLPTLAASSIHAVIADPPYGTTVCKWDSVIPFAPMWAGIKHAIKPRAAVVLFGSQPFTSALVMSNAEWFKYCWVWDKRNISNPQLAKYMPLKHHEDICIFADGSNLYNPQNVARCHVQRVPDNALGKLGHLHQSKEYIQQWTNYPKQILVFPISLPTIHPTQKPLALLRYLVRTYTNPGETVLDFTMGSGTTIAAALAEGRRGIGIENDRDYFEIAHKRVEDAARTMRKEFKPLSDDATYDDLPLFLEAT